MTLTVRVTVKESWNQLEKCNSSTFHKDIHHCLSLFSVNRFLCAIANTDVSHYCVKPVPPNTLSHCRTPMKRSLYQLNFSFISVGVLTTLWWTNTNKFSPLINYLLDAFVNYERGQIPHCPGKSYFWPNKGKKFHLEGFNVAVQTKPSKALTKQCQILTPAPNNHCVSCPI